MIKIENIDIYGFEAAIRGMRNPMNSWDKSDSGKGCTRKRWTDEVTEICKNCNYPLTDKCSPCYPNKFIIGENDLDLMKILAKAGTDHSKYLRMITVTMDIIAPLYWWKEYDTYKVGTVANSCSTMHKIHDKEFTLDDFSHEHLLTEEELNFGDTVSLTTLECVIHALNVYRTKFLETKDKPMKNEAVRKTLMNKYWYQMIQLLPSSYNQRRTVHLNYEVLRNMHSARKNHKLDEWRQFCETIETLPYFNEIFIAE